MPSISSIIPVFNTQKTLPACLDSVLEQTVTDIEALCVDDGSTDDSLSMLRRYALADARVRILRHERNRGVSRARNTGIEAAAGEYMAFVDSDDAPAYGGAAGGGRHCQGQLRVLGAFRDQLQHQRQNSPGQE